MDVVIMLESLEDQVAGASLVVLRGKNLHMDTASQTEIVCWMYEALERQFAEAKAAE